MKRLCWVVLLTGLAWSAGCMDESAGICQGGCPAGKICDFDTGRCVEPRPPDCPSDLGRYLSISADTTDQVVFSSYAPAYGDLLVGALSFEGVLSCQYVDGVPTEGSAGIAGDDVGLYSSLALDLLDRPHVAYFDRTHGRLKYALRTGEGWEVVTVPRRNDDHHVVGRACSLALDSDGLPHIAFLDETTGTIKVARKSPEGRWAIETLPAGTPPDDWPGFPSVEIGRMISLVLDAKDREWIAFQDLAHGGLKVAGTQSEGWSILTVDPSPGAGSWVSAGLDRDGNMAMAYHDRQNGSLNYVWNQAGSLQHTVVDDGAHPVDSGAIQRRPAGQYCALAFGHDGLPRIAYLDAGDLVLKLTRGTRENTFGEPQVLQAEGLAGFYNAFSLGPETVHLASCRFSRGPDNALQGEIIHFALESGRTGIGGR